MVSSWLSFAVAALWLSAIACAQSVQNHSILCDSPIYCENTLLRTVQLASLYPDSKTFVDKPTSKPLNQVLTAFEALGQNASREEIQRFVDDNFLPEGSELRQANLVVSPSLPLLDKIDDLVYRGWALHIHQYWANLTFEYDTSFLCDGCVSSTLPVQRPFVVPGGRFREFYYWDSYFVIRGLLISNLEDVVRDMLENFLDFVNDYGFVPNGARIYYLNRSQPPFLVEMVKAYYNATGDADFVRHALPILDKEYTYWLTNTVVDIETQAETLHLNQYRVDNHSPRPESYREDYKTVYESGLPEEEQQTLFANLAAGAESGWDYSSRWTRLKVPAPNDPSNVVMMRSLNNNNIVPVDLNALLWSVETTLAGWHTQFGHKGAARRKSKYYTRQAAKRLHAMEVLLWNDDDHAFYDYNLTSQGQNQEFTPAGLYPFWLGAVPEGIKTNPSVLNHVFDRVEELLQQYPGILTTSIYQTTMQWDLPNGWPPLQYIAINAMLNVDRWRNDGQKSLLHLAHTLADRFVASAFCSWYKTGGSIPNVLAQLPNQTDSGHMFEKFSVKSIGDAGGGGEYTVQAGFGWTNGVALWVFDTFDSLSAPDCLSNDNH